METVKQNTEGIMMSIFLSVMASRAINENPLTLEDERDLIVSLNEVEEYFFERSEKK